jgi:hypothetical protein
VPLSFGIEDEIVSSLHSRPLVRLVWFPVRKEYYLSTETVVFLAVRGAVESMDAIFSSSLLHCQQPLVRLVWFPVRKEIMMEIVSMVVPLAKGMKFFGR